MSSQIPRLAEELLIGYQQKCKHWYGFKIGDLPLSLNQQYDFVWKFKKGGGRVAGQKLKDEVHLFRNRISRLISRKQWNPQGIVAMVVVFYHPWITQELTVREKDDDNLLKPLRDAIQEASGMNDKMIWQTHMFKANCQQSGFRVWLFDLGTKIDLYEF